MQQHALREHIDNWSHDLTVDLEQMCVMNVALAGTLSKNGYRYSEAALSQAASLYNDRPVFIDHSGQRSLPSDRSPRDLAGSITNARFIDGKIRGDIRLLETESGQTLLKLIESCCPHVGMSHVVLGQKSADGTTVEAISAVLSVDVVVNPATTNSFRESSSVGLEGIGQNPGQDQDLAVIRERDQLKQVNQELSEQLQKVTRELEVVQLLENSTLPVHAKTTHFREQLLLCEDREQRRLLVQDRLSLLQSLQTRGTVFSQQRNAGITSQLDRRREEFLKVLLSSPKRYCEG